MSKVSRRRFTQLLGGASAIATTSFVIKDASAHTKMVDPESAAAKGLQYVLVSEKADNCAGCSQYTDDGSGAKGKCVIFSGNLVPGEAWCAAYAPKA